MKTLRLIILSAAAAALAAACTTVEVETWDVVNAPDVDSVYFKPGVDFSTYRVLYPKPFEIYYADEIGTPDPEDLARIRTIFRTAFREAIGTDYEIVDRPAPDALQVRASLVDLRTNRPENTVNVGARLARIVRNGELTFLMEMSDSTSGEVLAHAADGEEPSYYPQEEDWAVVQREAERWARLFRRFLDNNLSHL